MARKATTAAATSTGKARKTKASASGGKSRASGGTKKSSSARSGGDQSTAADALLKLLESPLVADLLAVGATAALAAIAEHRSSRRSGSDAGAKRAVKEAGKAAAAAIGRRLQTEFEEIKKAGKSDRSAEA